MAHLRERLGDGVVVRSDDIDGNDIIGTLTTNTGRVYRFCAHARDNGEIIDSDLYPE